MIYLKFCNNKSGSPIQQRVIVTNDYAVADDECGIRIYHHPGQWERVASTDWLNCFVMSETGKTIDKFEAPSA